MAVRPLRCWNHRILNVLATLPKRLQPQAKRLVTAIPYAETRNDAERVKAECQRWCERRGCAAAARVLDADWDRMVTFYRFPKEHWPHLRTTNPLDKKVSNATAVI